MKKWMSLLLVLALVLGMGAVTAAEEPSPLGAAEDGVYTNEMFGFRVQLPDSWYFLSDAELVSYMGYESAFASREGLSDLLKEQSGVCAMYAAARDDPGSNMNFMVVDMGDYAHLDEGGYLDLIEDSLVQSLTAQGVSDVTLTRRTFSLAGQERQGAVMTGRLGSYTMYLTDIFLKADHYIGALAVAAYGPETVEALLALFESLDGSSFVRGIDPPWSVIGSICGSSWDKDFPMIEVTQGVWVSAPLTLAAGDELKVRMDGDWAVNLGVNNGVCVQDGDNLKVTEDGIYVVTLDLNEKTLTCHFPDGPSWGVIGTLSGTMWDTDFPMAEDESGVWRSMPLALKAKDEFKVRMNGSWDYLDYGEDCAPFGPNLVVAADGVYVVTLDLNAMTLTYEETESVEPAAATASWGVIGTLQGTNWDVDFPLREVMPGLWTSDRLALKAGDEFKVRLNGSWAVNYGVTDGVCTPYGDNIRIEKDGLYTITLDLNHLTLTW